MRSITRVRVVRYIGCCVTALWIGAVLSVEWPTGAVAIAQQAPDTARRVGDKEPVAYIGHGAMFDRSGHEVAPTLSFISQAQAWYRADLTARLTAVQRAELEIFEQSLIQGLAPSPQSQLVINTYVLDWLIGATRTDDGDRLRGKNNLMRSLLQNRLSDVPDLSRPRSPEPFILEPELSNRLSQSAASRSFGDPNPFLISPGVRRRSSSGEDVISTPVQAEMTTGTSGAAYRNLCASNDVPIPPDFGPGSAWVSRGLIPQSKLFIVSGSGAEVLTYQSAAPPGMCVALPRFNTTTNTVSLDGVICLGQSSGKACFWDNEKNGTPFTFQRGASVPFSNFGGGTELRGGTGGICTDCHAGENPYIIHPNTATANTVLGSLASLGLPTFAMSWHEPIVRQQEPTGEIWPENPGPMNAPLSCRGCHVQGGAGRFPHISTATPAYCGTILRQAIEGRTSPPMPATMPPGAPGSLAGSPEMVALLSWCGVAANGDASGRGDPHMTTFNGTNYDFQGAGEFVYLRDGNGREIQARQTPVATAGVISPDPYTGLASCVSVTTAVAARVGKYRVSYQPVISDGLTRGQPVLRVDGKVMQLGPDGIKLGGGAWIGNSPVGTGIEIDAPDMGRLNVTSTWWASQSKWYMNVEVANTRAREGIMGAITPGNWLPALPDGIPMGPRPIALSQRSFDLNRTFADAWRVTDVSSLFDYSPGTSTKTFTDPEWPADRPPCLIKGSSIPPAQGMEPRRAEQLCDGITDKSMRAACIFDVSVTGEPSFANAYFVSQQLRRR
jgi:hypothetical protein